MGITLEKVSTTQMHRVAITPTQILFSNAICIDIGGDGGQHKTHFDESKLLT